MGGAKIRSFGEEEFGLAEYGRDEWFLTDHIHGKFGPSVVYTEPRPAVIDSISGHGFNESYVLMPMCFPPLPCDGDVQQSLDSKLKEYTELRSCQNEPKVAKVMMTEAETRFLSSKITSTTRYFEWGSGGSTDTHARLTNGTVVSIENFKDWCGTVS